jgi:hypothetical protein
MDYIKIVLIVYSLLRLINFIPNQKFTLDNYLQNTVLILLLVLLAAHDPSMCVLVLVAILVNTPNEYREKLFTNINKNEINNITNTLKYPKKTLLEDEQEPASTKQELASTKKTQAKDDECVPEFVISKEMLLNAQNNIFDKRNLNSFPNETNENDVNIQGVFNDINGYDNSS